METLTSKPGDYRLSLKCENFLGYASEFEVPLEAHGTPVPPVRIVGPLNRKFVIAKGVRIRTYVDREAICPGDTVSYEWTGDIEDELSFAGSTKKDLILPNVRAIAQKTYTFMLLVRLIKPDGTIRNVSKSIMVEATAEGSDIIPGLSGPEGDVVLTQDLVLTAQCFDPDDPEDSYLAFSYEYNCVRSLFEDEMSVDETATEICPSPGVVEGAQVTLPKPSINLNVWHTYTVTCSKASTYPHAPVVVRSGSASKRFIARSADSPIPTARIKQQCASTKCTVKNNPERPVVLLIDDLKYPDVLIEWSFVGATISEADTIGGLRNRVLIIKKNVLEAGTELECIATLKRADATGVVHSGEARIVLEMNTGPFCAADKCLSVVLASEDNVFPDAKFVLSASNFMDDEDSLDFSFGCVNAKHRKVQQRGPQTVFELNSLIVGTHTCFVCAIDRFGTHICEYAELDVVGPEGGVSPEEASVALNDVEKAKDSGDPVYVLDMVAKATNILQYTTVGRRLLLSENEDATDSLVNTIAEEIEGLEPFDLTIFQTSLDSLAALSSSYSLESANVAMSTLEYGIAATEDEMGEIDLGNILTMASAHSRVWSSNEQSSMDIAAEYMRLSGLTRDAIALMCLESLPGEGPKVATSVDSSVAGGICLKDFSSSMSDQQFAVGTATVHFPTDIFSGSPSNEQLDFTATFLSNSPVHSALLLNTPGLEANSGVADIGILGRESVCEAEANCWLLITMPLHNSHPDKETACVRIDDGMIVGLTGVDGVWTVPDSYDINANTIICNITTLGEVMLVSFPKPPPVPEPLATTSTADDVAEIASQPQEAELDSTVPDDGMAPVSEELVEPKPVYHKKVN